MRASVAVFFVLAVVMASANPVFGAMDQAKELGYRLQPSDVISITVHNQPDLSTKTRVTKEGYITFPLLGKVMVQGMTVLEIEQELKKLLEADYLVTAQVLVFI